MKEIMNTREVAGYLGLNEKRIYQLAKAGEIPATRIGGKWVFPRSLMDQWILEKARGNLKGELQKRSGILVVMGSNDLAWEIVSHLLLDAPYRIILSQANVGSVGGLIALAQGMAHVAGIHLLDPETGIYNIPYLKTYLSGKSVLLVNLFYRRQGLMVRKGNPQKIRGLQDLIRKDIRLVNRQKGSGTRVLLDAELARLGIAPEEVHGYHHEVDTHMAVAMEVLMGKATCGMGIYAMAKTLGLGFIPVGEERYDLAVLGENARLPQVEALLMVLRSDKFQESLRELGGYDLRDAGKIFWEGKV